MVDGKASHDRILRFLAQRDYTSKDLWPQVKSTVMQIEDAEGILIFDDRAQEESLDRRERPDVLALRPLPVVARSRASTCSTRSTTASGRSIPVAFELAVESHAHCDPGDAKNQAPQRDDRGTH